MLPAERKIGISWYPNLIPFGVDWYQKLIPTGCYPAPSKREGAALHPHTRPDAMYAPDSAVRVQDAQPLLSHTRHALSEASAVSQERLCLRGQTCERDQGPVGRCGVVPPQVQDVACSEGDRYQLVSKGDTIWYQLVSKGDANRVSSYSRPERGRYSHTHGLTPCMHPGVG